MAAREFRDFQDILTDLDDGKVHEQLTMRMRDVVNGARDANACGVLTLKITIKPDGRQMIVIPKVTTQIPVAKPGLTMFFADDKGDLRKEDPKQPPLKNVPLRPPSPLRHVEEKPVAATSAETPTPDQPPGA